MDRQKLYLELQKVNEEIEHLRKKKIEINSKLAEMNMEKDYIFYTPEGKEIKFTELFGDRKYLFTVHNMGKGCAYCTMWADGFNGNYKDIEKKGAFVLVSPDPVEVHKEFKESRGWKYQTVSSQGSTFAEDTGYYRDGHYGPGVSVFEKTDDGKIRRVGKDFFGPTDFFCNTWHFYDLLPEENITVNS